MKKNVGKIDKIIRIALAVLLLTLNLTGIITGTLSIVAWVVTASMVFTTLTSFCPVYTLLGINTCPMKSQNP